MEKLETLEDILKVVDDLTPEERRELLQELLKMEREKKTGQLAAGLGNDKAEG